MKNFIMKKKKNYPKSKMITNINKTVLSFVSFACNLGNAFSLTTNNANKTKKKVIMKKKKFHHTFNFNESDK